MSTTTTRPRLHERYDSEIRSQLMKQFGIGNPMAAPRLQKIVVNMGLGEAKESKELLKEAGVHLATITGQKAAVTRARKSIAGFKLREGMTVGLRVTLRRNRMYEFLDRLVAVAIPRVRDFRGLSRKAFDGRGNYSMGLSEQTVFPEIDLDKVSSVQGMDVTFVTTAENDAQGEALLEAFGLPFTRN